MFEVFIYAGEHWGSAGKMNPDEIERLEAFIKKNGVAIDGDDEKVSKRFTSCIVPAGGDGGDCEYAITMYCDE